MENWLYTLVTDGIQFIMALQAFRTPFWDTSNYRLPEHLCQKHLQTSQTTAGRPSRCAAGKAGWLRPAQRTFYEFDGGVGVRRLVLA